MSKWPRIYKERTLKSMYKKLTIDNDKIEYLRKFFQAASNFYEIIEIKELWRILSVEYKFSITKEEFIDFTEILRHEEHIFYILSDDELYINGEKSEPMDRTLAHGSLFIMGFDDFYNLNKEKSMRDFDYCILPEKEFMKYEEDTYYEHTIHTDSMVKFLKNNTNLTSNEIDDFMIDMIFESREFFSGSIMQSISRLLENWDISFNMNNLEKFMRLWQEMHNTTRMPVLHGYCPNELRSRISYKNVQYDIGPNIRQMAEEGDKFALDFIKVLNSYNSRLQEIGSDSNNKNLNTYINPNRKIGRNDMCPCGSGKKYKNCCGK